MRGATRDRRQCPARQGISIHAPHARSDGAEKNMERAGMEISIHAPHARSDRIGVEGRIQARFQSTLLMRGATWRPMPSTDWPQYFNPRSSCEERPYPQAPVTCQSTAFQSTLLMRGATPEAERRKWANEFQSTLLMRGATVPPEHWSGLILFQSTLLMRGATFAR